MAETTEGTRANDFVLNQDICFTMWRLVNGIKQHLVEGSEEFGLGSPEARAFLFLEHPMSMREIAEAMECDASMVTAAIDVLEERGLARRQPSLRDRRVKIVALTQAGKRAHLRFRRRLFEGMPTMQRLSPAERETLYGLLRTAAGFDNA